MQKIIYFLFVICFFYSCTTMQSSTSSSSDTSTLTGYSVKNSAELTDLVNYFAVKRNRDFWKTFAVDESNGNKPVSPDFDDDFVVGIAGKPSNKEMSFVIVKTEVAGEDLNVHYDYNYTWKELPMNASPLLLMKVSKERGISNVNFYSQNILRKSVAL